VSADQGDRDALEQRFAERLLEDEALRSALTDDEFQPLLDWALARVHSLAKAVEDPAASEAEAQMEDLTGGLAAVLRTVNDAVGARFELSPAEFAARLASLAEALRPPLVPEEYLTSVQQALARVVPHLVAAKDADDGVALVQSLVTVLAGACPEEDAPP
jgi:hypothetical protein